MLERWALVWSFTDCTSYVAVESMEATNQTSTVCPPTNSMPFGTDLRGPRYARIASCTRSRGRSKDFAWVWHPGSSETVPTHHPSSSLTKVAWRVRAIEGVRGAHG